MRKIFTIILIILFITSCTIYKKPKDLIPPDEMVNLVTDIYLANAASKVPNKLGGYNVQYLPLVYKKYKIDSARFTRSNIYYLSKIKEYKAIQEKALKKLEILKNNYRKIIFKQDSINKLKIEDQKVNFQKKS